MRLARLFFVVLQAWAHKQRAPSRERSNCQAGNSYLQVAAITNRQEAHNISDSLEDATSARWELPSSRSKPPAAHSDNAEMNGWIINSQMLSLLSEHVQWNGDIFEEPAANRTSKQPVISATKFSSDFENQTLGDWLTTDDVFADPDDHSVRKRGLAFFKSAPLGDWMILFGVVTLLTVIDFIVISNVSGTDKYSNLLVLGFWIAIALAFNAIVWYRQGSEAGILWFCGYFLEWILSLDNLFVFLLVFRLYSTPKALLHKSLFLGIAGAMLFRMFFFFLFTALLHFMHSIRFVFGAILIYSGIDAAKDSDEDPDVQDLYVVKMLKSWLGDSLVERYDLENHNLFVRGEDGRLQATLLVPVVVCLEATDVLFTVDSVSAKVVQIPNYYLAYSSSVLAIYSMRAMFFIIEDLVETFSLLKYGICFILVFIGIELMAEDYVKLPAQAVCIVIVAVFVVCTAGSTAQQLMRFEPPKQPRHPHEDVDSNSTTEESTVASVGELGNMHS